MTERAVRSKAPSLKWIFAYSIREQTNLCSPPCQSLEDLKYLQKHMAIIGLVQYVSLKWLTLSWSFLHSHLIWTLKLPGPNLCFICGKVCLWTNFKFLPFHPPVTVSKSGRSYEPQAYKKHWWSLKQIHRMYNITAQVLSIL